MEYYAALTKNEILTQATTWMNLVDIVFSEMSQSQKGNPAGPTPVRSLEESNPQRQEVDGGAGAGGGEGSECLMGTGHQFGKTKEPWRQTW